MEIGTTQIILIAVIVFMTFMVVKTLLEIKARTKRDSTYVQLFENAYKENSICDTLCKLKEVYKDGSAEKLVLEKSINYLNHSCLKDYQTAFAMIEDVYTGKKVECFHDKVLKSEKDKAVLLLEKKGE